METSGEPFLSVVVPVFNGAKTLQRTLQSLVRQQKCIEVITVIQAGSDGSREIIRSFLDRMPIVLIEAPQSTNWMQTTNLGLAVARAPYCTFLHQDDIWLDGRIEELKGLVGRHPHASLWVHAADFIDGQDRAIGRFGPPFGRSESLLSSEEVIAKLLIQNTFALPAVMFRRDSVLRLGGLDEELWYTADWDLWFKLAKLGKLAWLPRRLAGFRLHSNSLTINGSRNLGDFRRQMEIVVDRHAGALPVERREVAKKMGYASIELNVCLAAFFHGRHQGCRTALASFVRLGPIGMSQFIHNSQIIPRAVSRVRARWSA